MDEVMLSNEIIPPKVVIPLHGIRTHAEWQRAFVTLTQETNLENLRERLPDVFYCPFDEWSFGYFWLPSFLSPRKREQKNKWFRYEYDRLLESKHAEIKNTNYPSIVAHSFGTYILGHALIKYEYIKFDKLIFCGSILPRSFPWKTLIDRGQVSKIRNEYGTKDIWVRCAGWFIKRAGSSGYNGFDVEVDGKVNQKMFLYKHSEYFEKGHMRNFWIPFLLGVSPTSECVVSIDFSMEVLSRRCQIQDMRMI
jgi:serine/threonine-protein kinase